MNSSIVPGLKVRITQATENWTKDMDRYVGYILTIKEVNEYSRTGNTEVKFAEADGKYSGLNIWHWVYEQGHFEICDENFKNNPNTRKKFQRKLKLKLKLTN